MRYFDLNIPWPVTVPVSAQGSSSGQAGKKGKQQQLETPDQTGLSLLDDSGQQTVEEILRMLFHLGYSTCAFNLVIPPTQPFPANLIKSYNPCYGFKPPSPLFDPRNSKGKARASDEPEILQLSRLTLTLDEATVKAGGGGITNSNAALFANYDLLAVLPLDNYAFSHACQSLITPSPISIDIITLDLHSSPRLPFLLKRSHVLSAINAGVAFEVIYAPTISSSTAYPKDARRNVFAGVRELIRVTNGGRGILLSSSVKTIMELRAPDDLTSLLETLGAKAEHAKDALSSLPRNVVARGFSNRQTFKATIKGPTVETFAQTFSVTQKAVDGPADQSKKRARENTAPSTEPSQQPSGTATKPSKANKKQKSSR